MQIQEPEKAVRAFESALEFNPKDVDLITRVRRCTQTKGAGTRRRFVVA